MAWESSTLFIQSMPIAARASAIGAQFPETEMMVPGSQCPARLARVRCRGCVGCHRNSDDSNNRCRYSRNPNMWLHNMRSGRSGEPTTFSMTYGKPVSFGEGSGGANQVRVVVRESWAACAHGAEPLARGGCVDRGEVAPVFAEVVDRVGLHEFERVAGLRVDVHTNNVEPRPVIAD